MRWFLLLFLLSACVTRKPSLTPAQELKNSRAPRTDDWMKNRLALHPHFFDTLLQQNATWKISIIYTRVDRTKNGDPVFSNFYYNVDPSVYFYPASTVKMPAAFLSLQKLNELGIAGLDKESTIIHEAAYPGHTAVYNDPQSADGRPTIANYIRKIFLVSDNDAYNRLYEFLGQEYINSSLHRMGYDSTQIVHRLEVSLDEAANRHTNPVKCYDTGAKLIYQQPLVKSTMPYHQRQTLMGKGFLRGGKKIDAPFDFSKKNRITLPDLHSMLQSVIFPQSVPAPMRFKLKEDDYSFLYKYMSMKPRESAYPQYDSTHTDAYVKFFMFGGKGNIEDTMLRIFNKPGDAYGFLTDVAYIVDFRNGVEFFLSASIYCNTDGIFNDNKYDYEKVGFPFLKHLGKVMYDYELSRKRKYPADLSKFRISYKD